MLRLLLRPEFQQSSLILIPDDKFLQTLYEEEFFTFRSGPDHIATFTADFFSDKTIWERLPEAIMMAMDINRDSLIVIDGEFKEIFEELHHEWMQRP